MNALTTSRACLRACALQALVALLAPLALSSALAQDARIVLPTDVTPEHYRIEFTPNASALTFQGAVQIDITVHRATDQIVLNSLNLDIAKASLAKGPPVEGISYDVDKQTATLKLHGRLPPGSYRLNLDYSGKIFQQASGLFSLDYQTSKGNARALFTQFENSDARQFVPCWDEPARKATFDLTAIVAPELMAVSNMPIASSELRNGSKVVRFATTPKMSSYLLFFAAGDFERVHRNVEGVDLGIVVKRGDTALGTFSLDAAARILPYYNEYFGTPYPLPKLDLIAAPGSSQFFGAMENWGAIFSFETYLLVDPRITSEADKQSVYDIVAHEMAHQWFGDLVTMNWWDDLWLNEGFASWMSNKVTAHFHPEWKVWLKAQQETQRAMEQDERDGTHPIITPIKDVIQANGAFDTITYGKGAAVVRMLEAYAGEDDFRNGVRRYVHDHRYGNTVSDDLWAAIDHTARHPVRQIAHDFTLQAGVPMIEEVSSLCRGGNTVLQMRQSHFSIDASSTAAHLWHVPVTTALLDGARHADVVAGDAVRTIQQPECGTLIINAGQTAYFRTQYSREELARATAHNSMLTPEDQLGILKDTEALAYAGKEPMSSLFDLANHIPSNADPVVASALVSVLRSLDRLYDDIPSQREFRSYASPLLKSLFDKVGWDAKGGEGDNVALLRANLISALSGLGDESVIAEAQRRFRRLSEDPSSALGDNRQSILRVVARHADASTWGTLHDMAKTSKSEIERARLYSLLAIPEDAALVRRALDLALSGEPPPTIAPQMFTSASSRHPEIALEFATAHWNRLAPLIEPSSQARFVPGLVGGAFDPTLIGKLDAFADAHIPASARKDLRESESNIRYRAEIRAERLPQADEWLKRRGASV